MSKKEVLIAVIGGVIGAVLTMAGGVVLPLEAQNEVRDAEFGAITCKSISVKDKPGAGGVLVRVGEDGGEIIVPGKNGGLLGITGSTLLIQSGEIRVMGKQSTQAVMKGYENSVTMGIVSRNDKHHVLIGSTEDGGAIIVQSDDGSGQASMGISRGGGIVTTRDKNGNHSWASIGK